MTRNNNIRSQTFTVIAPAAMSVLLVGDFTRWLVNPIPMEKCPGGVWKAGVRLPAGTHHYRFIVDGECRGALDCTLQTSNPLGREYAVLQVA